MSAAEDLLAFQLKAVGIPFEREVVFAAPRKWRADFVINKALPQPEHYGEGEHYWMDEDGNDWEVEGPYNCWVCGKTPDCHPPRIFAKPILIEIDGATWVGGRHTTGAGVERDCEKANAATLLGYRLLRFVPHQVESGAALKTIEEALS